MHPRRQTIAIAALVLPVGGFVVGSVVSTTADDPPPRDKIIVPPRTAPSSTGPASRSPGSQYEVVIPEPERYDDD